MIETCTKRHVVWFMSKLRVKLVAVKLSQFRSTEFGNLFHLIKIEIEDMYKEIKI